MSGLILYIFIGLLSFGITYYLASKYHSSIFDTKFEEDKGSWIIILGTCSVLWVVGIPILIIITVMYLIVKMVDKLRS
mgnify:CR=1 FL=1